MNHRNYSKTALLTVLVGALMLAQTACDRPSPESKWANAVSGRVAGDYAKLHNESQQLANDLEQFCSSDTKNRELSRAQGQWRKTMDAWQNVQWVRFGPIVENNDDWKIQFWPDKKNIVARKAQQLLARDAAIDKAAIVDASVVIQGLSALELLLFDEEFANRYQEDDELASRQCQLLMAIGEYFVDTTGRVYAGWTDKTFQEKWLDTLTKQDDGPHTTALIDVIGALLTQMERVKSDKLGGPLGFKNRSKQPNGYFSEAWRSSSSVDAIKSNLLALQSLISNQDEYDLRRLLQAKGNEQVATDLEAKINESLQLLATIDKPLREAVTSVGLRQRLEELHGTVGEINSILKSRLPSALGVALGFNSNDGD